MWLVINASGVNTHTCTNVGGLNNFKKPRMHMLQASALGLKIYIVIEFLWFGKNIVSHKMTVHYLKTRYS